MGVAPSSSFASSALASEDTTQTISPGPPKEKDDLDEDGASALFLPPGVLGSPSAARRTPATQAATAAGGSAASPAATPSPVPAHTGRNRRSTGAKVVELRIAADDPMADSLRRDLPDGHVVECRLQPGSGRAIRTYRMMATSNGDAQANGADSAAGGSGPPSGPRLVVKALVVRYEEHLTGVPALLRQQEREMWRVRNTILPPGPDQVPPHHFNVLPYQLWFASSFAFPTLNPTANPLDAVRITPGESVSSPHPAQPFSKDSSLASHDVTPSKSNRVVARAVYLVRHHVHSTLADKIATRPFLSSSEKSWIAFQIVRALASLHQTGICHGNLTTENVGLTSWNWVLLMDLGTYKPVAIPDDDPSDFVRFFEERTFSNTSTHPEPSSSSSPNPATAATTDDNKRCYLAPERFYSTGVNHSSSLMPSFRQRADSIASEVSYGTAATSATTKETEDDEGTLQSVTSSSTSTTTSTRARYLTPAMDVFSLGCVIVELMLNGERALDLGDLMEYRKHYRDMLPPSLQQKLNKIESSSIRAACKHMLQLDPSQRWTASEYLERLSTATPTAPPPFPPCFESVLYPLLKRCVVLPPDARIALAALHYEKVVEEATGGSDANGAAYFQFLIGPTLKKVEEEVRKSGSKLRSNSATAVPTQINEISDEALAQLLLYAPGAGEEDDCFEFAASTRVPGGGGFINCAFPFCNPFPRRGAGGTYYRHRNNLLAETEELLQRLEPQVELTTLSSQHGKEVEEEVGDKRKTAVDDVSETNDARTDDGTPRRKEPLQSSASPETATRISSTSTPALVIYVQFLLVTIRHVQFPSSKLVAIQLLQKLAFLVQDDDIRLQRIVPTLVTISQQDTDASVRAWAIRTLTAVLGMIQSFPPSDAQIFPKYIFKRLSHLTTDSSLSVRIAFAECVASLAESALRFLDTTHAIRLYEAVDADTAVTPKEGASEFPDEVSNLLGHGEDGEKANETDTKPKQDVTTRNPARLKNPTTLIVNTYDEELATLHQAVSRWVVHIATDGGEMASAPKQALLQDVGRLCHFFGHDGVMTFILPQVLAFLNDRHDWRLRAALCQNLPSVCAIAGRVATEHFVVPCVEMALVDGEAQVMSAALHCLSDLMDMKLLTRGTLLGTPIVSGSDNVQSTMGLVEKYASLLLYPSPDVRAGAVHFVVRAMRSIGFPDDEVFILPLVRPFCRYEPIRKDLLSVNGLLSCLYSPLSRGGLQCELAQQEGDVLQIFPTDAVRERMSSYLTMLSHSRRSTASTQAETAMLRHNVEGAFKLSISCFAPNQMFAELFSEGLPEWFEALRQITGMEASVAPLTSLHRFSSTISQAYQAGLTQPSDSAHPVRPMGLPFTMMDWIRQHQQTRGRDGRLSLKDAKFLLSSHEAKVFEASVRGEWGAMASLDPQFLGKSLHSTELMGLRMPPLAPRLGLLRREDGRAFSCHGLPAPTEYSGDTQDRSQWKPKAGGLVATGEHTAGVAISRLAISQDYAFAASASHDGTCRLWELRQLVDSAGDLRSCLTYGGHLKPSKSMPTPSSVRLNDVAMMENSHSLATAASDGSVHVWRVEMVSSGRTVAGQPAGEAAKKETSPRKTVETARVSGTTVVRVVDSREGEALAVSHFNSMSSSVVVFATQSGVVHSWDLRSASEPFALPHRPEFGYLTSMAVGGDRNWMVTGSHRGFLSLWDIRFPRMVKLWRHSGSGPIHRLATSYLPLGPRESAAETPLAYVACGRNEASIFDISNGSCRQCFRVLDPSLCYDNRSELPESSLALPSLQEVRVPFRQRGLLSMDHLGLVGIHQRRMPPPEPSIRSMLGRLGTSGNNYLITGGTDCCIRYWDFSAASRCFTASGLLNTQPKPMYESVDHGSSRLFLCRQMPLPAAGELPSSKMPRSEHRGPIRPENHHLDTILDMKKIEHPVNGLLSCSADGVVKFWR